MAGQIINLTEYRKAKETQEVRKVVNDYIAEHSQTLARWLSERPLQRRVPGPSSQSIGRAAAAPLVVESASGKRGFEASVPAQHVGGDFGPTPGRARQLVGRVAAQR
jgi:hypothetical protein